MASRSSYASIPPTGSSGYKNQRDILLALKQSGPMYGEELVKKLEMHRQVLWRNLKVLIRKEIIIGKKIGRKKYYELNVNQRTASYIIYFLGYGGVSKFWKDLAKLQKKVLKNFEWAKKTSKKVDKYDSEIIELASLKNVEPYYENLWLAKESRYIKAETKKHNLSLDTIPESRMNELRKIHAYPKNPKTKIVQTSSGQYYEIPKLTLFQIQELVKDINELASEQKNGDYNGLSKFVHGCFYPFLTCCCFIF